MEKIKSLCVMRELFKALSEFENNLIKLYGVTLNEAMALCCIGKGSVTASEISDLTGLAPSHTSKVIRSVENKGMINRKLGNVDKRQMHFTLSDKGFDCIREIKEKGIEIPSFLEQLFK